ncbi:MAG: hypothetical protein KF775_19735, partial [Cyclobacteriaceae bacterium]|nr:hypothetical protein [Cyclobacteriaceae bacterium]
NPGFSVLSFMASSWNPDIRGPLYLGLDSKGNSISGLPSAIARAGGAQSYYNSVYNYRLGMSAFNAVPNSIVKDRSAFGHFPVVDAMLDLNRSKIFEWGLPSNPNSISAGPGDPNPRETIKQSFLLMLRIKLHLPDAISINGNLNMVTGIGTDLVYGDNTSKLLILAGPDKGKSISYWEIPTSVGWDISVGVNFTEYYYVPFGNQPLQLSNFQGFRFSVNGGFGLYGGDVGMGLAVAPLGEQGFILAISKFYGAGDPGPSFNVNWGSTNFNRK